MNKGWVRKGYGRSESENVGGRKHGKATLVVIGQFVWHVSVDRSKMYFRTLRAAGSPASVCVKWSILRGPRYRTRNCSILDWESEWTSKPDMVSVQDSSTLCEASGDGLRS